MVEAVMSRDSIKSQKHSAGATGLESLDMGAGRVSVDDKADIGRMLGPAFSQDHRRMRFGTNNLIQARNSRSTWR